MASLINRHGLSRVIVCFSLWALTPYGLQAQVQIRGHVRDAETGKAVRGATLQLEGATTGVIAGDDGRFVLQLQELPATVEVSHVGYRPQTLALADEPEDELEIRLEPAVHEMKGVVVEYEDPAVRIMREVIRRKRGWQPLVQSYTVQAYTRQTLFSDTFISGIRETVARIYWDREFGVREVVKAKRHTANVPASMRNFAATDYEVNLYEDEIEILGYQLIGPTNPEALQHYMFQLGKEEEREGKLGYFISVLPRDTSQPGFAGYVIVAGEDYAVVEAGLRIVPPIHPATLPTEHGMGFFFKQEFQRFEPGVWLPVSLRYEIDARFNTSRLGEMLNRLRGVPTPRARLRGVSRKGEYRLDIEFPELFFRDEKRLQAGGRAGMRNQLLETYLENAPLSISEEAAYKRLARSREGLKTHGDSALFELHTKRLVVREVSPHEVDPLAEELRVGDEVVTAVVQSATRGAIPEVSSTRLVPEFASELWYNRVETGHLGLRARSRPYGRLALYAKGGYSTGLEKMFYGAGLRHAWGPGRNGFAGVSYQKGTRTRYDSDSYSLVFNSAPVLLSLEDYFDYYWSERLRAEAGYRFRKANTSMRVDLNQEDHRSLEKSTDFNLVCGFQPENGQFYKLFCKGRDDPWRANPPVEEGRLRSAALRVNWGGAYRPFGLREQRRAELALEHSADWLGSDFSFTRYRLALDWHLHGGMWRLPGAFDFRLLAGRATGDLPVQRFGTLDASIWIFKPFGTFRSLDHRPYEGEQHAALFWEWNLGAGLFAALGMGGVVRQGMGVVLHGGSGRTWMSGERNAGLDYDPQYARGFHHEVGFSLVLPPLRLDVTRRLDRDGWGIGFGVARSSY